MRVRLLIVLWMMVAGNIAVVGQAPSTEAPATREDILKLFQVMNIHQQMRLVVESMMSQQRTLIRETLKNRHPEVTEEQMAQYDSMMQETIRDYPVDAMLDDMVPVYQKHLTRNDVAAMSVFYSSATGKKLLKEMPAMTTEGMQVAYARMQKQMESMTDRIQKMMQEDESKKKASPKPHPQTPPQTERN